jgi:SAM-dependent methyltransferase
MNSFYKQLTPLFHLVYKDWHATIEAHGKMLAEIIDSQWGSSKTRILDVSCGIGTQSLALATRGFDVTASDLSPDVVARAKREARARDLEIEFSVCDMREAHLEHGGGFDVVLCAGNALPHLLNDDEILKALRSMYACLDPGGGCIITMRQYDREERGTGIFKPFGVREEAGSRFIIFQVWDFVGERYKFAMYFLEEHMETGEITTHVMRSEYYAISPEKILILMQRAGFDRVQRLDDGVTHPAILVGTRIQ